MMVFVRRSINNATPNFFNHCSCQQIAGTNRLQRTYRRGPWRKRKGTATILLADGTTHQAEVHWYEATGVGRKEIKIKYLLD